jgi:putative NADH-flavin reductase
MKILLLGSTGRTGRLILQKALQDGHMVTATVRDPSGLQGINAEMIIGTPYDKDTIKTAINNCDAVINTLNISRTSDSPWAKLRAPEDLLSRSMQNVLDTMDENNPKRIIVLSALGAGESRKKMPFIFNLLVSFSNLKYAFNDHARQEALLTNSSSNWTVVRLPMLTKTEGEKEILVNTNDGTRLKSKINRESVARFVLNILEDKKYYKSVVAISNT